MLDAAKAMKLSAKDLLELEIIDEIIPEPVGGAHRDRNLILNNVKESISKNLQTFKTMTAEEIVNDRKNKFLKIGRRKGFIDNLGELSSLKVKSNAVQEIIKSKKFLISSICLSLITLFLLIVFL